MNCECGCGKIVNSGKRFILGHNAKMKEGRQRMSSLGSLSKDIPRPSEVKVKISKGMEGKNKYSRIAWNKGLTKETDERVKKNGESRNHPNLVPAWNKGLTKETDERVLRGTENMELSRAKWSDEKKKEVVRKILVKTNPNKEECIVLDIIKSILPEEYKINTKGEIIVLGRKVPDFVNVNGKKKLIEFFGEYYHKPEDELNRTEFFKKFGWDTLVIWGKELRNLGRLKEKILVFTEVY